MKKYFSGMTLLEIMIVVAILCVLVGTAVLTLLKTIPARSVEGETEHLAALIRSAQARAAETETVQAIFLCQTKLLWAAYPNKTIEEIKLNFIPNQGEQIRNYIFKDDVEINELWLDNKPIALLPEEPTNNIAVLIDERGIMTKAMITLEKEEAISWLALENRKVSVGKEATSELVPLWLTQSLELPLVFSDEEAIICETVPLYARGWQTVQINNTDKVKEVKLRIKTDIKLPESVHFHVYVFPGTYQNKKIARGISGIDGYVYSPKFLVSGFVSYFFLNNNYPLAGANIVAKQNGIEKASAISGPNGYYEMELSQGVYDIGASKTGYSSSWQNGIFINENYPLNFSLNVEIGGGGSSALSSYEQLNQEIPLGEWNAENSLLLENAVEEYIPVFNVPKLIYLYKDKVELLDPFITEYPTSGTSTLFKYSFISSAFGVYYFNGEIVSLNSFFNTGYSAFPSTGSTLEPVVGTWRGRTYLYGNYVGGNISSKLAAQPVHVGITNTELLSISLVADEIEAGEYSSWFTIPMQSLSAETKFLRIAIAGYHFASVLGTSEDGKDGVLLGQDKSFNLYPSSNSKHAQELLVDSTLIDYQTDPLTVVYPWLKWQNDPLWLSNYGYVLKPLTRPTSNIILATRGPYYGENYGVEPYKNFWYGPVFLDWDKLLGEEGVLWLLGWMSGAFGFDSWNYTQYGDTYNSTHKAAPSHYWLKSFSMLSYWYIFNYAGYFMPQQDIPRRIQLPINLLMQNTEDLFRIWEKPSSGSLPYESSSLSIEFMNNPTYPLWFSTLAPLFGQSRLVCSPDLYSSYFYVMQKINHVMLDTGAWFCGTGSENEKIAGERIWGRSYLLASGYNNGNLDKWRLELAQIPQSTYPENQPYSRASWWSWYTSIPWAKGVAFPIPSNLASREGWEAPIVEPYPPDSLFVMEDALGNPVPNPQYNNIVKNQPNTIFMSTAHYPLGTIEIKVKK